MEKMYECAYCGKQYGTIEERTSCEGKCAAKKKLEESKKREAETARKKKLDSETLKLLLDEGSKQLEAYVDKYGEYPNFLKSYVNEDDLALLDELTRLLS